MTASAIQPKKQLALDTDWLSAAWALGAFFAFGFLFISTVWMTVRGNFKVSSMTWVTPFFAACLLFIAIGTPEKLLRIAAVMFAIGPLSRLVLWATQSSYETRLGNEIFVRWIESALFFAICVYIVYWFRLKIKHV